MSGVSSPHRAHRIDMLGDVSRAQGLAQALAHPLATKVRPGSTEEVANEIVSLLDRVCEELLSGV